MSRNIAAQEVPLREAQAAIDLLPMEVYPDQLPYREKKPSRLSNMVRNRIFHTVIGFMAALLLIAGAGISGYFLGKRIHDPIATPPLVGVTVTPLPKTHGVTMTDMVSITTTSTQRSTVWSTTTETITTRPTSDVTVQPKPKNELESFTMFARAS